MKNKPRNFISYIGIDVGGTSIKFGIFDKNKKIIEKFYVATEIKNSEKQLLEYIFDKIENYYIEKNYVIKNIKGIGFAMPGPVVSNKLIHAININWNKKIDIVKETKEYFGKNINVAVLNDANAAALAEYKLVLKEKYKSICLITLGTGVGTGIIINGELIEGKTGIAGECSHIRVDYSKEAKKCTCGNVGCIETFSGSKGLIRIYKMLTAKNMKYSLSASDDAIEIVNMNSASKYVKMIIDKAKNGDKIANETIDLSFNYLANLIAILMHVYEPEVILIGGGISNAGRFIVDKIKKHLKQKLFMTKILPKIQIAKLKNDAGIYGSVIKI